MNKVLTDRRDETLAKAEAIVKLAEDEKRGMSAAEREDFDAQMKEVKRLEDEIEAEERASTAREALDAAKRYTVPAVARSTTKTPEENPVQIEVVERDYAKYKSGDALGAIVAARMRFGAWQKREAVEWSRQAYGERAPQTRALQQSSFTAGGAFIPENFVGREFIERLTASAMLRKAGARALTLTNGSATIPKLTGGATGSWIGQENDNVVPSQQTTGEVKLVEKKYMVLVPISNDLRRNSSLETERIVADDIVTVAANDEDLAFLRGSGLAGQPKGIYYWVAAAAKTNQTGTSLANVRTDIRIMRNRLDGNNVPYKNRAWFMPSRSMNYIGWDLVDGNSNFAFPSMQNANGATLAGDPVYRDNNIPITLGSGDKSEHYYVEMSECFIGDSFELGVEIIENAVYADSAGVLRSGVSRDESAIRLIRKVDFGMRHTESAAILEAVNLGV